MDDDRVRQWFLDPTETMQRRYEALRAFFVDERPLAEIAETFGYKLSGLKSLICRFRCSFAGDGPPPFSFRSHEADPPACFATKTNTVQKLPRPPIIDNDA